ncbi:MAG: P44/Msp2 family outer membrane protein [Reyranella sp.]|uniref:outer membrane protein n=1 Tax=Reyranella sp. TaxID=1929291 RepID=UPI001AC7B4C1|nr:P44/Msp2 family outer membrane protein [Reyranella sp.]MBN9090803.1 P44/Msp2 family outer membrane protein [Reyranella sp.]
MKSVLIATVALAAVPLAARAQNLDGFYVGARGGASWLLDSAANVNGVASVVGFGTGQLSGTNNARFDTGWAAGGFVGYDFVGPRVELEALYRDNKGTANGAFPISGVGTLRVNSVTEVQQTSVMANLYYDFFAHDAFTPYVGAGAGLAFIDTRLGPLTRSSDIEFAYQAIVGAGYKVTPNLRLNLDGRYYGTLNPTFNNGFNLPNATVPVSGTIAGSYPNNNFAVLASVVYTFGPSAH